MGDLHWYEMIATRRTGAKDEHLRPITGCLGKVAKPPSFL